MLAMEDVSSETMSKKRKIISHYESSSSSSSDEDIVCYKEKRNKYKANQSKKTCHKECTETKKIKTSEENKKQLNNKSFKKIKKERQNYIDQEEDEDKKIELEVWYYLLHHLEESEKLIALKLLVGINKMKKNWKEKFLKNKYVDKKVVDEMKLVIKTLQEEQEKNRAEKEKLIQERNKLEKMVIEERKCRIQLEEILANKIKKSNENVLNKVEESNKVETSNKVEESNKVEVSNDQSEDKQQSQTTTEIVSKQKPSTSKSKISLNDNNNNNTQVLKIKGDMKNRIDLRDVLNHRENLGTREHHINSVPPPMRYFSSFAPQPPCRRFPPNFNNRFCVKIKTTIRHFSELMKLIENKLKIPMRVSKVMPFNGGWKIEFLTLKAKFNFLKQRNKLTSIGLHITH
ncbi:leucine-rich repeat and IQ domain-containing protein 1-like [Chelonus insularis]|uniref:leucine-rich repeat and IQ domain-containing protein 1-like n=1 Tax=Chelonus insularis TaxID=460826 RepID=UPI00158B1082|nr:leucine-rich repeat and IQ domain-containing protein 1-like [Chelonus insularis]